MADTVKLNATFSLVGTVERDAASAPASETSGRTDRFTKYNESLNLTGSTTPKVTQVPADLSHTLSGGTTKDFDLSAAPIAEDINRTQDYSGKKVIAVHIKMATGNNAAGVTFGPQGVNGYDIWGGAGVLVTLYPGQRIKFCVEGAAAALADVAAAAKDLRFTGTDGDSWECIVYLGEN